MYLLHDHEIGRGLFVESWIEKEWIFFNRQLNFYVVWMSRVDEDIVFQGDDIGRHEKSKTRRTNQPIHPDFLRECLSG